MKPIIKIEGLSKRYRIGKREAPYETLRESLTSAFRSPFKGLRRNGRPADEIIWALKDVGFEVMPGEVVGIIGRNGAGKSTLLKILSRITEPSSGFIDLYGRVGSLLEVGTGFHPELTGRENIFLNGAILGMKRSEIARKFDEIVAFAEIEKFIDTPVKRYSSGMYMRLAFAVAAHLEPEILLVDEVLAVGDLAFQKKCLGKMSDVAEKGRTVLFVSHNMAAVENLCERALMLHEGSLLHDGSVSQVTELYLNSMLASESVVSYSSDRARIAVSIVSLEDQKLEYVKPGDDIAFKVNLEVKEPLKSVDVGIGIANPSGDRVVTFHSNYQLRTKFDIEESCTLYVEWPRNFLCPGNYTLVAALYSNNESVAHWNNVGTLSVMPSDYFGTGKLPDTRHQGYVLASSTWHVETR